MDGKVPYVHFSICIAHILRVACPYHICILIYAHTHAHTHFKPLTYTCIHTHTQISPIHCLYSRAKTLSTYLTSIHEHKKRHYDDMDSAYTHSSRDIFQNLGERCSEGKVKYLTELCESVADACFAQERARYSFMQRVCSKLTCVRGMLTGAMKADPSTSTSSKSRSILYRVAKYMCVVIVLVVACFQVSMLDTSWIPYMLGRRAQGDKDKDLLSMYAQKQQRQQNWMSRAWHTVFRDYKNK
ncbi:hypothetical protein EON63_06040 [archaeon]|nr:MAG: hypothetical protein EON63_06040 [archaeon]